MAELAWSELGTLFGSCQKEAEPISVLGAGSEIDWGLCLELQDELALDLFETRLASGSSGSSSSNSEDEEGGPRP